MTMLFLSLHLFLFRWMPVLADHLPRPESLPAGDNREILIPIAAGLLLIAAAVILWLLLRKRRGGKR